MQTISIRTNFAQLERKMTDFAFRQVPAASALAVTAIARRVERAERANMESVLDCPTPFTVRGVGSKGATAKKPTALVFVKPITAEYLEPYEFGGLNKLNGKALNKPVRAPLNKYGNLSRRQISTYAARSDIYIGTIKTRDGRPVSGVWQRQATKARVVGIKTGKVRVTKRGVYRGEHGRLKLLVRFTDAHPVKPVLGWHSLAKSIIPSMVKAEVARAMRRAIVKAS